MTAVEADGGCTVCVTLHCCSDWLVVLVVKLQEINDDAKAVEYLSSKLHQRKTEVSSRLSKSPLHFPSLPSQQAIKSMKQRETNELQLNQTTVHWPE